MKRGEIWSVGLDPAEGHEQKGRRPVLIVSPEVFNRVTKVPVVLPITSVGNSARTAGFAVSLTGSGTKTTGVVRCDQPRALDLVARGGKKLEGLPRAKRLIQPKSTENSAATADHCADQGCRLNARRRHSFYEAEFCGVPDSIIDEVLAKLAPIFE